MIGREGRPSNNIVSICGKHFLNLTPKELAHWAKGDSEIKELLDIGISSS